jgi:hypothetical protein
VLTLVFSTGRLQSAQLVARACSDSDSWASAEIGKQIETAPMMADATHHRFMDVIMTRAPETDFVASHALNVPHSKYQQSNDHLNCAEGTP